MDSICFDSQGKWMHGVISYYIAITPYSTWDKWPVFAHVRHIWDVCCEDVTSKSKHMELDIISYGSHLYVEINLICITYLPLWLWHIKEWPCHSKLHRIKCDTRLFCSSTVYNPCAQIRTLQKLGGTDYKTVGKDFDTPPTNTSRPLQGSAVNQKANCCTPWRRGTLLFRWIW